MEPLRSPARLGRQRSVGASSLSAAGASAVKPLRREKENPRGENTASAREWAAQRNLARASTPERQLAAELAADRKRAALRAETERELAMLDGRYGSARPAQLRSKPEEGSKARQGSRRRQESPARIGRRQESPAHIGRRSEAQLEPVPPDPCREGPAPPLLKPSLPGAAGLAAVQEVGDAEASAVTLLAFGHEYSRAYVLLAAASRSGLVTVYRIFRSVMERAMLGSTDLEPSGEAVVLSRLEGHTKPVTALFFDADEEKAWTASHDKSIRLWFVDTGEVAAVFADEFALGAAAFLPLHPTVFVTANENAGMRVWQYEDVEGEQHYAELQALQAPSPVRALRFDDTGQFMIAGTASGCLLAYRVVDTVGLKFKFKTALGRGAVSCLTFVAAGQPCLVVSAAGSVAVVDCLYGMSGDSVDLTGLSVRHTVKVAPARLQNGFSPSGACLFTGNGASVYAQSLSGNGHTALEHHKAPVVAVAVTKSDALLASGDAAGRIVLWRRSAPESEAGEPTSPGVPSQIAGSEPVSPAGTVAEELELMEESAAVLPQQRQAEDESGAAEPPVQLGDCAETVAEADEVIDRVQGALAEWAQRD